MAVVQMVEARSIRKVLIVDDEWESPIVKSVRRRLEDEGWQTLPVDPGPRWRSGDEFEDAALYAIEVERPEAVLLDVRFGEHADDRFKGLGILRKIVERFPSQPVLMFTQSAHGPDRDTAVGSALKWDVPVDFIDKLASPEEVVLRLRRLTVDLGGKAVSVMVDDQWRPVDEIQGMKFEILGELATSWYRSPGELVPFHRLERYSEGDDPRSSLRVRIREIKNAIGGALGLRFGASDLIVNVRDRGYRLMPPKDVAP